MMASQKQEPLGPVQTPNFTCAESHAYEQNLLFSLISIRFGTCEVRRLNRALFLGGFFCYNNFNFAHCSSFLKVRKI